VPVLTSTSAHPGSSFFGAGVAWSAQKKATQTS